LDINTVVTDAVATWKLFSMPDSCIRVYLLFVHALKFIVKFYP